LREREREREERERERNTSSVGVISSNRSKKHKTQEGKKYFVNQKLKLRFYSEMLNVIKYEKSKNTCFT
jgi:hypothetical protein